VNDVVFSPDGKSSFAIGHDATLYIINNKTLEITNVNLQHNACNKILPLSDNKILLFSYDREIFLYENINNTWVHSKTLSDQKEESKEEVKQTSSVLDRLKQFDNSNAIKKNSTVPPSNTTFRPAHDSIITSFNLFGNELITTDASGFIKLWKL